MNKSKISTKAQPIGKIIQTNHSISYSWQFRSKKSKL